MPIGRSISLILIQKIKLADINRQIQKDAENARLRAEENKKTAEYREAMLKLQQQRIAASQNGKISSII